MSDSPTPTHSPRRTARRTRVIILSIATLLLAVSLLVLQAFNTEQWFAPGSASETLILFALSTLNVIAFIVLLMVLARNIIKLRGETRPLKLGSRFTTRLVSFSVALSLLPVVFMFSSTVLLINRSVDKWFSLPTRKMAENARQIRKSYLQSEEEGLQHIAVTLARIADSDTESSALLRTELSNQQLNSIEVYAPSGKMLFRAAASEIPLSNSGLRDALQQIRERITNGEATVTQAFQGTTNLHLIAARVLPQSKNTIVITRLVDPKMAERMLEIDQYAGTYEQLHQQQRAVRTNSQMALGLLTLFALFIATWMAIKVARSIAEPVQQLAEATERIRAGDLSGRADIVGDDELAALARSFNEMAAELQENREQVELSAAALDERRRYIETILQNLSAGVISLDEHNRVTTINPAAIRLLRLERTMQTIPASGAELAVLLPEEQREELWRMIRRALRGRTASREVHFKLANNVKLDASVTVTALPGSHGELRGTVIVIEDLSDVIEAQRRSAWSEVARRMAHEIKNPLTPIRLSAERLAKNLLGLSTNGTVNGNGTNGTPYPCLDERGEKLVRECTSLIGAEVATLQRMVDEFSSFARLPAANPVLRDINEVIADTLKLYEERLDGIKLESRLATDLPPVMIDQEQIKRALVNLIDNAMNAITESNFVLEEKSLRLETREVIERDAIEITVADTGPGIAPADRERIFSPYFSTRKRGTGLGLAIVSHIVAEHSGRIRVEDNFPQGARFVIELPSAKE
ncbi:MAG: HAMP domain-containing protein [Acidobacteria bacterium]|nr:HAMP domain-containing protein [Acidobacteriota bacterium]